MLVILIVLEVVVVVAVVLSVVISMLFANFSLFIYKFAYRHLHQSVEFTGPLAIALHRRIFISGNYDRPAATVLPADAAVLHRGYALRLCGQRAVGR